MSPIPFFGKLNTQSEKSSTKMWVTFVVFKKLPKVNNHPKVKKIAQSGHTGPEH
jgi:hypothetical protein